MPMKFRHGRVITDFGIDKNRLPSIQIVLFMVGGVNGVGRIMPRSVRRNRWRPERHGHTRLGPNQPFVRPRPPSSCAAGRRFLLDGIPPSLSMQR